MRILVTGSSGFVGGALSRHLESRGHVVVRLGRGPGGWNPQAATLDLSQIGPIDAAVHLAGASLAGARWTAAYKARIRDSRTQGTRLLASALAACQPRPAVLVSTSAVGYYGNCGGETVDENHPPGAGFLADVCRQWEAATAPAAAAGIRVVLARLGVVLDASGGALARMLPPFRLGLGGVIGAGNQFMSWVTLADLVSLLEFLIARADIAGPVNCTAPGAVTNRVFTKTLGRVLRRPTVAALPGWLARLALGEMADALLLGGARVEPRRLCAAGYQFLHPELEPALRQIMPR